MKSHFKTPTDKKAKTQRLFELLQSAKTGHIDMDKAKEFYRLKGYCLDRFKYECEQYSKAYFAQLKAKKTNVTELQFINHNHCRFIIDNVYKTKG